MYCDLEAACNIITVKRKRYDDSGMLIILSGNEYEPRSRHMKSQRKSERVMEEEVTVYYYDSLCIQAARWCGLESEPYDGRNGRRSAHT